MSAYAASLRSVAPGSIFFFLRYPGFRGFAAPPPGYFMAPPRGSELGSLALANYPTNTPFNFRFIEQQTLTSQRMAGAYQFLALQG